MLHKNIHEFDFGQFHLIKSQIIDHKVHNFSESVNVFSMFNDFITLKKGFKMKLARQTSF